MDHAGPCTGAHMTRRLIAFALILGCVLAGGCGRQHRAPSTVEGRLAALAVKCHETEAALASQFQAALNNLSRHRLQGSRVELTTAVDELVNYAAAREPHPSCPRLLAAFVAQLERRPPPKKAPPSFNEAGQPTTIKPQ